VAATLRRRVVRALDAPLDAVAARHRPSADVVILIYHRIGGRSSSPVDLPASTFERQLDTLASTGSMMSLDDALAALATGQQVAGARYVLTFDDGTADWADVVAPILSARGVPGTFYVATDYVDGERALPDGGRPVTWAGLAELVATGWATIGSHTHTHRVLAATTAAEAAAELDRSVGLIEEHLGVACDHFAYPKAVAGSAAAETVVRRRFASAALAGNRANRPAHTDVHRLGRHGLTVADDDAAFARKAAGGGRAEGWLRERRDAFRAG